MTSPLAIGLVLGAGVFCIYWSFWAQAQGDRPVHRGGFTAELRDHLTQAGYPSISPSNVIVGSIVLFVVTLLLFAVLTKVVPIALCLSVMAAVAPISLVPVRAADVGDDDMQTRAAGEGRIDEGATQIDSPTAALQRAFDQVAHVV